MKKQTKTNKPRGRYGFPGLTIDAWAFGAGMNHQTLEKMFRREGIEIIARRLYSIRDFVCAIAGDKHAAEVRNLELDARRKEREEKIQDGSIVPWELVEKEHTRITSIIGSAFDAAPDTISREWIEKVVKPAIRAQLEKPKVNGEK